MRTLPTLRANHYAPSGRSLPTSHWPLTACSYNSPNPPMRTICRFLALLIAVPALAADLHQPESQLSAKIAAVTGPGVIALDVTNRSSISSPDAEQIRRALVSSLADSGVRVWGPDQAAATVRVTLSENLRDYVWVAEIHQGINEPAVALVSAPRPDSASSPQSAFPLTLHATRLTSEHEPILDAVAVEGSPRRMVTLTEHAITVYTNRDGRWIASEPLKIEHAEPFPRDPRGRIILRTDHLFDVYLPGYVCHSVSSSPVTLSCSRSDDPWPLGDGSSGVSAFFAPQKNFFTGALVPGIGKQKSAPAFYSAAAIPRDKYTLWIFAGVDGQTYFLDGINQQAAPKIHWGSDIAAIRSSCRAGTQVLATSNEPSSADSVQAFEFPDREPLAVSQKLALAGPITALWPAQDGESATAVIHNSETGDYEALLLTLACRQ